MKQSQRIAKNVFAGGLAVGVGGLIQLAAVAIVARTVGVAQFGVYSFILAFAMFIQLLADSGLSNILVRELARTPERMPQILGAALSLIWALTGAAAILMLLIVPFLHFPASTKLLTILMGLATLAQFHAMGYGAVLRSQEENELHAIGFLGHKVLFFICIVAGLHMGMALLGVVVAHLIPNLFQWGYYRWIVDRRYTHPKLILDWATWKYLMAHSLPVGGAAMLRLLSQQIDVFILAALRDIRTVGLFSGPYRISLALRFIPQTLSLPLYPMYARMARDAQSRDQLQAAYTRSVKFFLICGLPVTILFFGFAGMLIELLLGPKFREATVAMRWVGLAFLPFFISNPLPFLLTALDEQRFVLWSTVLALLLRVGLNFALIPVCGFLGPCIAFFASETLLLIVMIGWLWRRGFPLPLQRWIGRPLLAGAAMAAALVPFQGAPLALVGLAAVGTLALYGLLLVKLGTFSNADMELIREGGAFLKPFLAKWSKQPTPV